MKTKKLTEMEKVEYREFIKMAQRVEEQAKKFIERNIEINPQKHVKYSL